MGRSVIWASRPRSVGPILTLGGVSAAGAPYSIAERNSGRAWPPSGCCATASSTMFAPRPGRDGTQHLAVDDVELLVDEVPLPGHVVHVDLEDLAVRHRGAQVRVDQRRERAHVVVGREHRVVVGGQVADPARLGQPVRQRLDHDHVRHVPLEERPERPRAGSAPRRGRSASASAGALTAARPDRSPPPRASTGRTARARARAGRCRPSGTPGRRRT